MHPTTPDFIPGHQAPNAPPPHAYIFLYHRQHVALIPETELMIPTREHIQQETVTTEELAFFGHWEGRPCYAGHLPPGAEPEVGLDWQRVRSLFSRPDLFWIANRGHHLAHWHATHRYCGRCGTTTVVSKNEVARQCPTCSLVQYPKISPAVIMSVTRGNKVLLGKISRPGIEVFSVLAGFVEPGETLEGCVAREVMEETGIAVKNICYFGSQPWAFPDQLMVGFTAEYAGGEITLDDELEEADWFDPAAVRSMGIPPRPSIARALLDHFLEETE